MNLQLMAYELIQIMTGGMKHFTFFPIDIFISKPSYICILEGTEFLPLIMYFKLEQTYMYIHVYYMYFWFEKLLLLIIKYLKCSNVSKSFTFILLITCNFKSIYKRSYKLLFLVQMTAFLQYVCFLIKIKIFFPNYLFWDILSLWNPMGSLDHSNEVLRKYKPCVMNKKWIQIHAQA